MGCGEDQYMFGPNLLVAPILYADARTRTVYLPSGMRWTNAWTGEGIRRRAEVEVEAPLDTIPLFVTEGEGSTELLSALSS